MPTPTRRTARLLPRLLGLAGLLLALPVAVPPAPLLAQQPAAVERPVPLDSAGRVPVLTPTLVNRLSLPAAVWPVTGSFREARLFRSEAGAHVIVVQRPDGSVERFPLSAEQTAALRDAVTTAWNAQAARGLRSGEGAFGMEESQPAGNTFVRNQIFLGLVAYGPATAALLSDAGGGTATAGYFLAAGGSFFVAANTVRNRTVTRAQAALASHGGLRGAAAGAAIAAIADASGGPGYGAPILAGALGGTIAGFQGARGLSDGEAGASGLMADLAALTTLGLAGAGGAFKARDTLITFPDGSSFPVEDDDLRAGGKAALGAAVGAGVLGYLTGPRYARRAAYNVTAGDTKVAFTGALLGALASTTVLSDKTGEQTGFALATGGMLAGFVLSDRLLVRTADRTAADGTLVQLGALAGALIGGGVAAGAEADGQVALAMATIGGALGLLATDRIARPSPDAGPLRGIMTEGEQGFANGGRSRGPRAASPSRWHRSSPPWR